MFGTAAPFLGQGGIDPRMVSGPANAYMQQMQSLPIQGMMGGGGFQGGFGGGQGPQMDALRSALHGYQGGNAMPWGQPGGMQGGQDPRQSAMMAGRRMPDGSVQSGGFVGGQWQPNGGQPGMPPSGPGSMESYMPQPRIGGVMPSFPMTGQPAQPQPFRPQGPGQRVTPEQLAARGLDPQEIQRKLQQFSQGQLGWQRQSGQGGRGGMVDPTTGKPIDPSSFVDNRFPGGMPGGGGFEPDSMRPDPNDPRFRDFIRRMTGDPATGGGQGQPDQRQSAIRRMVAQNPRGGPRQLRPPMVVDPQDRPYGNDMISRPVNQPTDEMMRRVPPPPRFQPPMRGGGGRDNRQQTDVQNIRY
jgi:hypothetical protein